MTSSMNSKVAAFLENVVQMQAVWPYDQIVFSIFGHLQQQNGAQKHLNCAKVS